jgi:hypothetical protein
MGHNWIRLVHSPTRALRAAEFNALLPSSLAQLARWMNMSRGVGLSLSGGVTRLLTWSIAYMEDIPAVINRCFDCKITRVKSASPTGGRRCQAA